MAGIAGFRACRARRIIRTSAMLPEIYNVIDARQAEAQNTVIEALRGLGHSEAAGPLYAFFLRDGRADRRAALRNWATN